MPSQRRQGTTYSRHGFYSATRRLSDHGGDFYLEIACRYCRHAKELSAKALAARFGKNTVMAEIEKRLCCKQCGRKDFGLKVSFDRKARGWSASDAGLPDDT